MIAPEFHKAALLYTRLGWHILAVHVPIAGGCSCGNAGCGSPGKHPKQSKWTKAIVSPEVFANGLFHNIGIVTGAASGIVVIDVDAGGEETLARLEREHGPLPPTVMARTGGGGRHIYFRHPGVPVKNDVKKRLGPGVDIRGDGGFVVVPPSLHASGKRYEWFPDSAPWEREIAALPAWLLALLQEPERVAPHPRPRDPNSGGTRARGYAQGALKRACEAVAAAPEGARNDTLNTQAFGIGQLVGGRLLARSEAEVGLENAAVHAGLPEREIHKTLRSALDAGEKEARGMPDLGAKVGAKSSGSGSPGFILGKDGPKAILENICRALRQPGWDGLIVFDELALRPVLLAQTPAHRERSRSGGYPHAWDDSDDAIVTSWLQAEFGLYVRPSQLQAAVLAVSKLHPVHAVRDYLDALRWDGAPRLDLWLHRHFGVRDEPLTRAFGSKFLISAVARVREPGAKVDHMLILEGEQGAMKSSGLETLMPAPELFMDDLGDALGKEAAERIAGKWLVEVAELDAMSRAEVTRIKSFITRRVDRFRPSYGRWALDAYRQCVFAGTTNADVYLKDETGGRRFWPVRIGTIDIESLRRDRDQLWAEAKARHATGEHWWLEDKDLVAAARAEQRTRFVEDVWQPQIEEVLSNTSEVTISSVLQTIGVDLARQGQAEQNRVAKTLKVLGWRRVQVRHGGERAWVYRPSPVSPVTTPDPNTQGKDGGGGRGSDQGSVVGSGAVTGDSGDARGVA